MWEFTDKQAKEARVIHTVMAHNYGDCVTEHKDSERPKWEQYEHLVLDHAKV